MEVLNTLCIIDQDCGGINGVYLPHQILIHSELSELIAGLLSILDPNRPVSKITAPQCVDDILRKLLHFHIESVVPVGGFALEGPTLVVTSYGLPVNHYRIALVYLDSLFLLKSINRYL